MRLLFIFCLILLGDVVCVVGQQRALVFESDFGMKDGAVAAMKGVAFSISSELKMYDLTHDIPAYNIWEAAYRLDQAAPYWPAGTVFVCVVDPGVGSARKSVVLKTKSGHFFVSPDNGSLTLVAESLGIDQVREIDEAKNRRKNSDQSYTFHGRDVYAYTGARLAAGIIKFEDAGPLLKPDVIRIPYERPVFAVNKVRGNIVILDIQYGNLWTNINQKIFEKLNVAYGEQVHVKIFKHNDLMYEGNIHYGRTFADVPEGNPVGYINSLLNFSIGINQGDFSSQYKIGSGSGWSIELSKK